MMSDLDIDRQENGVMYRDYREAQMNRVLQGKCKTCYNQRDGISYYCAECRANQVKRMRGAFHSKDVPSYVKVANEASQEAKTYE